MLEVCIFILPQAITIHKHKLKKKISVTNNALCNLCHVR